ncbi:hypothetical protein CIG75_05885 [Tumebacillus algifaecis]|uniref:Uncharacterized protein n=1 Tax=Tumebacillus algifaecis TaxID=1214604 RepID=A0A223CZ22_9BACL|nr:hypothetical protein CIG75_05885 [Tumebacillus algifaecis]
MDKRIGARVKMNHVRVVQNVSLSIMTNFCYVLEFQIQCTQSTLSIQKRNTGQIRGSEKGDEGQFYWYQMKWRCYYTIKHHEGCENKIKFQN